MANSIHNLWRWTVPNAWWGVKTIINRERCLGRLRNPPEPSETPQLFSVFTDNNPDMSLALWIDAVSRLDQMEALTGMRWMANRLAGVAERIGDTQGVAAQLRAASLEDLPALMEGLRGDGTVARLEAHLPKPFLAHLRDQADSLTRLRAGGEAQKPAPRSATGLNRQIAEVLDQLVDFYGEAHRRPLIGLDPASSDRLRQIRDEIFALEQRATALQVRNPTVRAILGGHLPILRGLDLVALQFDRELQRGGMTFGIAMRLRDRMLGVARRLNEGVVAGSLRARLPLDRPAPVSPRIVSLDLVQGALLAAAVGEALGAPFEGMTAEDIAAGLFDLTAFISRRGRPAGRWTDDMLLILETLDSIVKHRAVVPGNLALRFQKLRPELQARGAGQATIKAVTRLARGRTWREAGAEVAAGSGAAMRILPIALLDYRDLEILRRDVILASRITHAGYEAVAGALAVAFIQAKILRAEFDPQTILAQTQDFIGPGWFSSRLEEAREMRASGQVSSADAIRMLGTSGLVWESVVSAIYTFLASPNDFMQVVTTLIRAGGDTDTMASIAGSFYGALNGTHGIPPRLMEGVEGGAVIRARGWEFHRLISSTH